MKKIIFISLLLFISITITSQVVTTLGTDSTPTILACPVQTMPEFPGGTIKMMKFINENLKFPEIHNESSIEGRVILKFLVEEDGHLTNITVMRSLEKYLDEEAIRVVRLMPKWIPSQSNGKNVACYYTLPVSFKLTR